MNVRDNAFPPQARRDLAVVFRDHTSSYLIEEALVQIAQRYDLKQEVVKEYFGAYSLARYADEPVTIYIQNEQWLAGLPCSGWSYGTRTLPQGVWVVGLIKGTRVLIIPYLHGSQRPRFIETLAEALLFAGDLETEAESLLPVT